MVGGARCSLADTDFAPWSRTGDFSRIPRKHTDLTAQANRRFGPQTNTEGAGVPVVDASVLTATLEHVAYCN